MAGGTLRIGVEADVAGLNPASNVMPAVGMWMGEAVFDTLAKVGADGSAVPHLAESITPDDTLSNWTMKLRSGVKFHDGTPVNADAVIATFEGQLADPLIGLTVVPLFAADNLIEKVDDLTVVYHLSSPSSVFPLRLTTQMGVVASKQWLDEVAANPDKAQEPVGSGPFRFDSRTKDSVTRFVRNDDYWAGAPYLDAIEFYPVPDSLTRADQLSVGDLDMLHSPGALADLPDDDVIQSAYDKNGEEGYLAMNTSKPPFDDIRVRKAFTYTYRQNDFLAAVGAAEGDAANQMFDPTSPFFNPDLVQHTDSPEMVGDLISSYCVEVPDQCTDGRVDVTYSDTGPTPGTERNFAVLNDGWKEWFNVTPRYAAQDQFIISTVTGDYEVTQFRLFGGIDPDLDRTFLLCASIGGIAVNVPRYCDPTIDELLAKQAASTDQDERAAIWQEISQRIADNYTTIWAAHSSWRIAYDSTRVRGLCDAKGQGGEPLKCVVAGRTALAQIWLAE
jgi:peptide/nickel transport system substrate-binding protein